MYTKPYYTLELLVEDDWVDFHNPGKTVIVEFSNLEFCKRVGEQQIHLGKCDDYRINEHTSRIIW